MDECRTRRVLLSILRLRHHLTYSCHKNRRYLCSISPNKLIQSTKLKPFVNLTGSISFHRRSYYCAVGFVYKEGVSLSLTFIVRRLSTMLKNRQNQAFSNAQKPSKTTSVANADRPDRPDQEASHQQALKDTADIGQHTRSRSLSSLQTLFTRPKRPTLQRSTSQSSAYSTTALSSCTSSSSSSITSSTSNKESTFSKILRLFAIKGNNKSTLSLANTSALPSQKSLEFEALLEEYPSRTIKASLTPCTAA